MANLVAPSGRGTIRAEKFHYDFAIDGGNTGAYGTNLLLPQGALVIGIAMLGIATITGGAGATIDVVGAGSSTSYFGGAITVGTGNIPTIGLFYGNVVPPVTGATAVNGTIATISEQLNFVIAVNNLTAGAFDAWVMYIQPSTM